MKLSFRSKIMTIMGIFSILLTLVVSFVDQGRQKNQITADYNTQFQLAQDNIVTAISDADNAFALLDGDVSKKMKQYSDELVKKYQQDPNFDHWDFQALKNKYEGMDVYVIDAGHTVLYSSFTKDVGLDFSKNGVQTSFTKLLTTRLQGSDFVADNLDQETNTGKIKKYSYIPTPDHKFLVELGVYAESSKIFEKFNFLKIGDSLVKKYSHIEDITVFASGGKSVGKTDSKGKAFKLIDVSPARGKLLLDAVKENKIKEYKEGGVTYRYIPYNVQRTDSVKSYTDHRVVEIKYNTKSYDQSVKDSQTIFVFQALGTIIIALLISYVIARLVARPMYLAFHDTLTGLSNRASFETSLTDTISKGKKRGAKTGLLSLDLDNFKKVNDTLGHDGGDFLLKDVGRRVRSVLHGVNDVAARLGGDEFVVILENIKDENTASDVASRILEELKRPILIKGVDVTKDFNVTASIGIALTPDHAEDGDGLYKKADIALYNAKQSGKNTFRIYNGSMKGE